LDKKGAGRVKEGAGEKSENQNKYTFSESSRGANYVDKK